MSPKPPDDDGASVEALAWEDFDRRMDWNQGEHVSLIGPTRRGKTTLGLALLPRRDYTVVFVSKPRDRTLAGLARARGWYIAREWPPPPGRSRVLLWPVSKTPDVADFQRMQRVFADALRSIYQTGGWCVFADDTYVLCRILGLGKLLELVWANGAAIDISLVAGIQRPAFVPLMAYDQPVHLFFWRDNDEENLRRIAGIGSVSAKAIRYEVARLPHYHALYVCTLTNEMTITRAPKAA